MAPYTMVAVPTELVSAVIEFIESQGERPSRRAQVSRPDEQLIHGWDAETLKRAYRDSNLGMREVLDYLARHPDDEVDFDQVGEAIDAEHGWMTVAGRLGGFSRRLKRYGLEKFPWHYREESDGRGRMEMPAAVAEVIRDVAGT
jgi:hypothetical protein